MRSLKQLFATGTRRIVVAAIVLIALGIAILAMTREDHGAALMMPLLYSILAVGILWLAIYFGTKAWRKRKRKEFDEGVAAKEGIEDRRREWGTWVEELEKQGIDRYELPFYLLVGEPQSGKSVLLHNSDLHFPFGQSRLSGVGGTRGCDWWFTEEAVILDMAGRLFTHEGGAADKLEFQAFLKLLSEFRPLCPANGVILVIPCDSLLTDTVEECRAKATKLQSGLAMLTAELQALLPVYLVLTKGDQIFGFAESVHRLDVERRHQMFGWSRPADKVDAPFDLTEASNGFTEFVRRARVLRSHMAAGAHLPEALPEIDRLFAFPHELEGMRENLETYLSRIFTATNLTDRVTFRGMYLTSGLQTGVPIANVCNDLFGKTGEADRRDLQALFNKQKAYFIKDLIRHRIFGERGLVRPTQGRLEQTQKASRVAYGISSVLALAAIAFAFFYVMKPREESIQNAFTVAMESVDGLRSQEDPGVRDCLTTLHLLREAIDQDEVVAEKITDGPQPHFERVYRHVFDTEFLPALRQEVASVIRKDLEQLQDDLDFEDPSPGKSAGRRFDRLVADCKALVRLISDEEDYASQAVEDELLAVASPYPDQELNAREAFTIRRDLGETESMVVEKGLSGDGMRGLVDRSLALLEDCWNSQALRPAKELGYMMAWFAATEAREILVSQNLLTGPADAIEPAHRFRGALTTMRGIQPTLTDSKDGITVVKYNKVVGELQRLSSSVRLPLARFLNEGAKENWDSRDPFRDWCIRKFTDNLDDSELQKWGINAGGSEAGIELFNIFNTALSTLNSEIPLKGRGPEDSLDDPAGLSTICENALPIGPSHDPHDYVDLGEKIWTLTKGKLKEVGSTSRQYDVFHRMLLDTSERFLITIETQDDALRHLVPPEAATWDEPDENTVSMLLVKALLDLHTAVDEVTLEISPRKRDYGGRYDLQTWLTKIEQLLVDHLSRAGRTTRWMPALPESGNFAEESWDALRILADVESSRRTDLEPLTDVLRTSRTVGRNLFEKQGTELTDRWRREGTKGLQATKQTVLELNEMAAKMSGLKDTDLLRDRIVDNWGRRVDEMFAQRLVQMRDEVKKIWTPSVLEGSLESSTRNAIRQLGETEIQRRIEESRDLEQVNSIASEMASAMALLEPLKFPQTATELTDLDQWRVPTSVSEVDTESEYVDFLQYDLPKLRDLGIDGRKRGERLAEIYVTVFREEPTSLPSPNAGIQMVRYARAEFQRAVEDELRKEYLDALVDTVKDEDFYQVLDWRPDGEELRSTDVARGLRSFFRDGGAFFELRHAFQLVDSKGEDDGVDQHLFPEGGEVEGAEMGLHYFLRGLDRFFRQSMGEANRFDEIKLNVEVEPVFDTAGLWDGEFRQHFWLSDLPNGPSATKHNVGRRMSTIEIQDWSLGSEEGRVLEFLWSDEARYGKASTEDRFNVRFEIPSCLAPLLLAWQGTAPDEPTVYEVSIKPPNPENRFAKMRIEFEKPLPPRPKILP